MPWIAILRDALAIIVARSLVKATLGAFGAGEGVQGAADFGVLVVAFCAIGCASPARRLPRLGLTAAATWTVVLAVALLRGASASHGRDLVATLIAMVIGGAASLAIVRTPAAADGGPATPPGS